MVPVTAITMMNAVIASPVQRWSHKMLFRNMSSLSGIGVPFDVNETCGKVTGGFVTPGSAGRKAQPTRLNTAEEGVPWCELGKRAAWRWTLDIVQKDVLPAIASAHDVVHRPRIL